jgi:cytochrome P450
MNFPVSLNKASDDLQTSSAISLFLYAMFIFPHIAKKVHEEIVRVVGEENLPTIADKHRLPYTEAVWKESLRWNPGTPLGKTLISRSTEEYALI